VYRSSSSEEEDGSRDEERRHQFFAGRGYARRAAAAAASAVAAAKIEDVDQKPILEESEVEDGNWVGGVDFGALLAEHNDAYVDAGAEGTCLCACCCCFVFCLVGDGGSIFSLLVNFTSSRNSTKLLNFT